MNFSHTSICSDVGQLFLERFDRRDTSPTQGMRGHSGQRRMPAADMLSPSEPHWMESLDWPGCRLPALDRVAIGQTTVHSAYYNGRGERIRTSDLRYPKPSRYQAALRPEPGSSSLWNWRRKGLVAGRGGNILIKSGKSHRLPRGNAQPGGIAT